MGQMLGLSARLVKRLSNGAYEYTTIIMVLPVSAQGVRLRTPARCGRTPIAFSSIGLPGTSGTFWTAPGEDPS